MAKQGKQEEFLKLAHELHKDIYDYSKVIYKNNDTKVCIICPKHGDFYQSPRLPFDGSKTECFTKYTLD